MSNKWKAGQAVEIGGRYGSPAYKAIIERVTPSGRAVIGGSQFAPDGTEIGGGEKWRRTRIEPWTDKHTEKQRAAGLEEVRTNLSGLEHISADVIREAVDKFLADRKKKP